MSKRTYYALAVLMLLIAATLRLWDIPKLPVGFSDVEISHINVVEDDVRQGAIRVFYERELHRIDGSIVGQEGLYHIVLGAVTTLFGTGTFGLRVFSALLGLITLSILYALGVRLFGQKVGLIGMAFYAVLMYPTLLSRLVLPETALPLMVAGVLLAIARAFPVYYRTRAESSNTVDYALMGVLISLSLYLHENSLFIVLTAMLFIAYMMLTQRTASERRISYIAFGLLMMIIIVMPYGLSTFRLYSISANSRILGEYGSITLSIVESMLGLMWRGDTNPLVNVPGRPLMDLASGFILIVGLLVCVQKWRNPQFALVLLAVIFLGPPAVLGSGSPNFLELSVVLPVSTLLVGIGAGQIMTWAPKNLTRLLWGLVVVLWAGNLVWTVDSLFNRWPALEAVQEAYNQDIGQLAQQLDMTADEIPVVICHPEWNRFRLPEDPYNDVELVKLHMNANQVLLREVDCRNAFVFPNAGRHQQVLIVNPMRDEELSPLVADWLSFGEPVAGMPDGTLIELQVQSELEDALGVFTTTAPASYATDADVSARVPVAPPIRFGGNVTWLGYENDPLPVYAPDSLVPVATYWRIEGLVPSDLVVFTHLLSDPLFPAAQVDTIHIDPTDLRERDIYLHNADIQLPTSLEDGDYVVSVGMYQSSSDERLPVFINESATQGNRIFLYQLSIEAATEPEN